MAQPRPPLLIAVCVYECLAGFYIFGSEAFSQFVFFAISPGAHLLQLNTVHSAVVLLTALLSFGIAVALWNLRRVAFFLSLMKLLVTLFTIASVLYVLFAGRLPIAASLANDRTGLVVFWIGRCFDFTFFLITIFVAVYAYRITMTTSRPKHIERDIP